MLKPQRWCWMLGMLAWSALRLGAQGACGRLPTIALPPGALSAEQSAWMGDILRQQSLGELDGIADPVLTAFPERVLGRLTAFLPDTTAPIHFHLLLGGGADAYVLPGNNLYLTRAMASLLQSEDELAGVLAHEAGHLYVHETESDGVRQFPELAGASSAADFLRRYRQALIADSHRTGDHRNSGDGNADAAQDVADAAALQLMARAGYDPAAFARAFDRVAGLKGDTGSWLTDFFHTTAVDARRLRTIKAGAAAAGAGCPAAPASDPGAFDAWQAALADYTPPPPAAALPGLDHSVRLDPLRNPYRQLHFSPDGRYLLAADDGGVAVLSTAPLALLFRIAEPKALLPQFSPDSASVVLSTTDQRVERWDIATRRRIFLRQVVPSDTPCLAAIAPRGDRLACLRPDRHLQLIDTATSQVLFDRSVPYLTGLDFSPDGSKVAVKTSNNDGFALALDTAKEISLPGSIRAILNRDFVFLNAGEVLGTADPDHQSEWVKLSFPEGKTLGKVRLGRTMAEGETHGGFLIARPWGGYAVAVVDGATGRPVMGSNTADLDGYDDLFATESSHGAVTLLHWQAGQLQTQATLDLPPPPIENVTLATTSPDLNWLAISGPERGAVWNLASDPPSPPTLLPGFGEAWFDGSSGWITLLPNAAQRQAAQHTGLPPHPLRVRLDLLHPPAPAPRPYSEAPLPLPNAAWALPLGSRTAWFTARPPRGLNLEVHATADNRLLWTRRYSLGQPLPHFVAGSSDAIAIFGLQDSYLKTELARDPGIWKRLQTVPDARDAAWVEILDADTGVRKADVLLDPAPRINLGGAGVGADAVYLADAYNQVLAYSLGATAPPITYFGKLEALSSAVHRLVLATAPDRLAVYAAGAEAPLATLQFPQPVLLARFSPDGSQLLVVTADQIVYYFHTADWK